MNNNKLRRSAIALGISSALLSAPAISATLPAQTKLLGSQYESQVQRQVAEFKQQEKNAVAWLVELNGQSLYGVNKSQQAALSANITDMQQRVMSDMQNMDLGLNVITRTSRLANALVVEGEEAEVRQLENHSDVKAVYPVYDYELAVADSADYIKATPLVENGLASGKGARVAVLDTGIDYTHAAFGGEGTAEAYAAAIADETVTWPQGIVQGGYDFYNMDDDPIDNGTSHGTHVSHSVTGIAPDVELFVYSVCAGTCPGVAQLMALEEAMDPNKDMDIADRVDVINMSLGGDYGDIAESAVGLFINRAVTLGTNVVISAGNDNNIPYIVGGPSTTENALSVGAMTHPTDEVLNAKGTVAGEEAVFQAASFGPQEAFSFSSEDTELVYPDANQTACTAFADGTDFTGKAVILDRGACAFTQKVLAAQEKGAAFVIIANNNDDGTPAPMGGFDAAVTIPSVGVSYATGMQLKEGASFSVSIESVVTSGAVAGFSSRGPSVSGLLKPEITAPGVNIMTAHPGTGDGLSGASGTSFSGPITAGAMSILKEALPERNALELKATLMNAANLDVTMTPKAIDENAELAPISIIGSGLVDVEKAANLPVAAWAKDTGQAALSFGLHSLAEAATMTKTVQVKNFSNSAKTYDLAWQHRFADDQESGAISAEFPSSVTVPAGQTVEFDVTVTIDPTKLPEWQVNFTNSWSNDAGALLTKSELDGALVFNEGGEHALHMVYHVLPRAAAKPVLDAQKTEEGVVYTITNEGATDFEPVIIENTATDEVGDAERLDIVSGSVETLQVPANFCASGYGVFTTIVLNQTITSNFIGNFAADYDLDSDGVWDARAHSLSYRSFANGVPPIPVTYSVPAYSLNNLYFDSGTNFVTLQNCIEDYGLTAADLGMVNATVRFRVGEGYYDSTGAYAVDMAQGSYNFAPARVVAMAVDAQGDAVESLAPGESAQFLFADANFTVLSTSGSAAVLGSARGDMEVAPSLADAEFSVDENTAKGTVIGTLAAMRNAPLAGAISEFIVTSSTSTAVEINDMGEVVVANAEQLDFDAGLEQITLTVVATDTYGQISNEATVMVKVNNLADEASEQPKPQPKIEPKKSTSSGTWAWLTLLMAPALWLRRRRS
ncbi:S8 family serine peptidase [Pseudoalteromonas sp. T1lg75]|uniref:S8 family serine peptidase n=1 Tax=Pseudoalteromonas sp. T1lg75 TaxID=2077102 RepID=UPI000CF6247E|nr:S8 family serine peptidase [Pseudoalteromonas sp. T1lg75]